MSSNTHVIDRAVRLVLGLLLLGGAWIYLSALGILLAAILGIAGLVLVVTAAIGWCPIYGILGISTCRS